MDKKITWSERAEKKFLDILDFWVEHNKSTTFSEKLIDEVSERLLLISRSPYIGIRCNRRDTRFTILRSYRIYYTITSDEIHILAIWDMRQNPDKIPIK